jgi:uncharacterized membrane protein
MPVGSGWHLPIGDSSPIGLLTVAAYLVAAYLAHAVYRASRDAGRRLNANDPREAKNHRLLAKLWMIVAIMMLVLAVCRHFALLMHFVEALRNLAQQEGWYANRYRYQAEFVYVIIFLGVLGISLMLYWLRSVIRRALGAVLALNFMIAFVIIRGSSYHPIDVILYGGNAYWNLAFEFGGLCAVAATALQARRSGQPP